MGGVGERGEGEGARVCGGERERENANMFYNSCSV